MLNVSLAMSDLLLLFTGPRTTFGLPGFDGGLGIAIKALIPIVGLAVIAPVLWWFFRDTWRQLDAEAVDHRQAMRASGGYDFRPAVLFAITALILTLQEYYGGRDFYYHQIRPWLQEVERAQRAAPDTTQWVNLKLYNDLYGYGWWAFTRVFGYIAVPFLAWKLMFRKDSLLDMGLRVKGLWSHAWIYGACLVVVIPAVFIVARSPEFANYYPFYKKCSRSYLELIIWESMYIAQFFALEVFFRGFWLAPLRRSLGSSAIFAMCVPYVMIHYGKPYLESMGAFVAGVALGSLAMKTRSIYSGFLVHVTVALLMDSLALLYGPGFPTTFWPPPGG